MLRRWLGDLAAPPAGRTFLNFLASHDGIGLRPVEGLVDEAGIDALVTATNVAGGVVNSRCGRRRVTARTSWRCRGSR